MQMKLLVVCAIFAAASAFPSPNDVVPEMVQHSTCSTVCASCDPAMCITQGDRCHYDSTASMCYPGPAPVKTPDTTTTAEPCKEECADKTPKVLKDAMHKCVSDCTGTKDLPSCLDDDGKVKTDPASCSTCVACLARNQETKMTSTQMVSEFNNMMCKGFVYDATNPCDVKYPGTSKAECRKRVKCTMKADQHKCRQCEAARDGHGADTTTAPITTHDTTTTSTPTCATDCASCSSAECITQGDRCHVGKTTGMCYPGKAPVTTTDTTTTSTCTTDCASCDPAMCITQGDRCYYDSTTSMCMPGPDPKTTTDTGVVTCATDCASCSSAECITQGDRCHVGKTTGMCYPGTGKATKMP